MNEITIFTPTYNRAYILEKAYNSLLSQTNKNFVWMIIDDGSTDNTESLVKKWIKQDIIKIIYYKKENGGKHSAYNFFLDKVETKYAVVSLDSDDYFVDNAIEKMYNDLNKISRNIHGITYLCDCENRTNAYIYNYKTNKLMNKSFSYALSNNYFNCGAVFLLEVGFIKNIKFPIFKDEKFFTEAYLYFQYDFDMMWTEDVVCIREFIDDGLTKNTYKLFVKYPNSWYEYNKLRVKKVNNSVKKFKYIIYSDVFGIMSKNKYIKESKYPFVAMTAIPIAFIIKKIIMKRGLNNAK